MRNKIINGILILLIPYYFTMCLDFINMYALGMTTTDIQDNIKDIYGADISPTLISSITDKVIPEIKEWQSRPLEKCYPIIYLDAIHFKVKDGGIYKEKAVYTVIGINVFGMKELLGLYLGDSESASFWQTVCVDLSERGIKEIFIACIDGLSGFSNAIKNIFPKTVIQKCVIHQIRNSIKHVSYKDSKEFVKDLKNIYQAPNLEIAEQNLLSLDEKRGKKYGLAVKSWINNWAELSTYFAYPYSIRKLIYTTNIIEGFHRQIRKSTKNRPTFPHETSLMKLLYLVTKRVTKKWTTAIHNWGSILNQFDSIFDGRVQKYVDL